MRLRVGLGGCLGRHGLGFHVLLCIMLVICFRDQVAWALGLSGQEGFLLVSVLLSGLVVAGWRRGVVCSCVRGGVDVIVPVHYHTLIAQGGGLPPGWCTSCCLLASSQRVICSVGVSCIPTIVMSTGVGWVLGSAHVAVTGVIEILSSVLWFISGVVHVGLLIGPMSGWVGGPLSGCVTMCGMARVGMELCTAVVWGVLGFFVLSRWEVLVWVVQAGWDQR